MKEQKNVCVQPADGQPGAWVSTKKRQGGRRPTIKPGGPRGPWMPLKPMSPGGPCERQKRAVPRAATGEYLGVFLPLSSGRPVSSLFYLRGPRKNSKGSWFLDRHKLS